MPMTTRDFEKIPKGQLLRLRYDEVNVGEFWWWHSHVTQRDGEMHVYGAFRYEGDTWSPVDDYLYEFLGLICRGSGAEPVMLMELVDPEIEPDKVLRLLEGVKESLGDLYNVARQLALKGKLAE